MTIDALPPAPVRSDSPNDFIAKEDAWRTAMPTFGEQVNAAALAMNFNSTNDTSASSVAIGTGAKTFTVSAGKSFQGGQFLVIADTAAPSTNWMAGQVTSYSGTTLVMNILAFEGSGTKSAWIISQNATGVAGGAVVAGLGANTFTGIQTLLAQQRMAKGADVASAAALTLGTDGNYFDVTGAVTVTSIGTVGVGTVVGLHFDAALTLTHHATDLILPTAVNILTAAGDEALFIEYAVGDWRCISYTRASGLPVHPIITLGSPNSSTGVTSIDYTSLPSGIKEFDIDFSGTSLSGTSDLLVQLGDSGGFETTTYVSGSDSGGGVSASTAGFVLRVQAAANVVYGHMHFSLADPSVNEWVSSHSARIAASACTHGGGNKALSGELTQIRITTVNGTDTIDAGKVNIAYKR